MEVNIKPADMKFGPFKALGSGGSQLSRPQPVHVQLGDDSNMASLPVAVWYAERPMNSTDENVLELKVFLTNAEQIAYFKALDEKNMEVLGEQGPIAFPRGGLAEKHMERYKKCLWERDDGRFQLNVGITLEKIDAQKKAKPTAIYRCGSVERPTMPERADASAIQPKSLVILRAEALWLWYNSQIATFKFHATDICVFDPPSVQTNPLDMMPSLRAKLAREAEAEEGAGGGGESPPPASQKRLRVEG